MKETFLDQGWKPVHPALEARDWTRRRDETRSLLAERLRTIADRLDDNNAGHMAGHDTLMWLQLELVHVASAMAILAHEDTLAHVWQTNADHERKQS